jgi:uncharacterized protein (TIGR02145 family)
MKKYALFLVYSFLFLSLCCAQSVTIGAQVWSTKNLDVSTFRNGDKIPQVKTAEEWQNADKNKQPAWCYYAYDPTYGEKYGKLYNWYAVNDKRGLAPEGWHVPSDEEWKQLTDLLGGDSVAGKKMKSTSGWWIFNTDSYNGGGTNESGFSGLPNGYRSDFEEGGIGAFYSEGEIGSWWSASESDYNTDAWILQLYYGDDSVGRSFSNKSNGLSVRCLKD